MTLAVARSSGSGQRARLDTREERRALPAGAVLILDWAPRCWRCGHPLAWHAARPWSIKCRWCGATTSSPPA